MNFLEYAAAAEERRLSELKMDHPSLWRIYFILEKYSHLLIARKAKEAKEISRLIRELLDSTEEPKEAGVVSLLEHHLPSFSQDLTPDGNREHVLTAILWEIVSQSRAAFSVQSSPLLSLIEHRGDLGALGKIRVHILVNQKEISLKALNDSPTQKIIAILQAYKTGGIWLPFFGHSRTKITQANEIIVLLKKEGATEEENLQAAVTQLAKFSLGLKPSGHFAAALLSIYTNCLSIELQTSFLKTYNALPGAAEDPLTAKFSSPSRRSSIGDGESASNLLGSSRMIVLKVEERRTQSSDSDSSDEENPATSKPTETTEATGPRRRPPVSSRQ